MAWISALTVGLVGVTATYEYYKLKHKPVSRRQFLYKRITKAAILIASKDGEQTIRETVAAARKTRCDVYVVSDGSTDNTVKLAKEAGAKVLGLRKNIGKPSALHRAYKHFKLSDQYTAVAILDDDVIIAKDFIRQTKKAMGRDVAISVGKNITEWPDSKRWNVWLASRAYSYWSYQLILRRLQSAYNVMNCISGSNSLYRTEVLDQVLSANTPYIVDDTFWTLETHRLNLGEIVYVANAHAWIQDPTNFRDWYKQNLRWMWGTFQGILGHNIGSEFNKFHMSYVALMLEWLIYVASGPIVIWMIVRAGLHALPYELVLLCSGYAIWVVGAALALKRPRLVLFIPAVVVVDFIFRALMVHALIKAFRQRTVESCVWVSPKRLSADTLAA